MALGSVMVLGAGLVVTTNLDRRNDRDKQVEHRAITDARTADAGDHFGRIEGKVDALADTLHAHQLEFSEFKGENRADHAYVKAELKSLKRGLNNVQAQVRNLANSTANRAQVLENEEDDSAA